MVAEDYEQRMIAPPSQDCASFFSIHIIRRNLVRSRQFLRYEGDFLKGQIHGRGRYMWSDGGHYEAR